MFAIPPVSTTLNCFFSQIIAGNLLKVSPNISYSVQQCILYISFLHSIMTKPQFFEVTVLWIRVVNISQKTIRCYFKLKLTNWLKSMKYEMVEPLYLWTKTIESNWPFEIIIGYGYFSFSVTVYKICQGAVKHPLSNALLAEASRYVLWLATSEHGKIKIDK